jgi:hypothetical protein
MKKGFTLVEVMVSIIIFILVFQMILLSISFSAKINRRAEEKRRFSEAIGKDILEGEGGEAGEISLSFGEYRITAEGTLYRKGAGAEGEKPVYVIWMEELAE